jgi:LCP family protein required for cell wall assembly
MRRSDFATGNHGMNRMSRWGSRRRVDRPTPWYLNPRNWVWMVIGAALLGTTLVIVLTLFFIARAADISQEMIAAATQTPASVAWNTPPPGGVGSTSGAVIEPWAGNERFTILVMGIDRRPGELGSGFRSDTTILVSIDPATNSLGILSIPRDLYVVVPGLSVRQRINSALALGELRQLGYGPQLAMETVQLNFGTRVHEYLTVDFTAFTRIVDEIGGIDINVPTVIYDPYYPDQSFGYDPLYIPAGLIHMDGEMALKYARTRHTSNDFDRARRQQQVIYAIRDRIINAQMWPQLIAKAPTIWQEFSNGVQTGLDFGTILRLAMYLKDIPSENIHAGAVDQGYVSDWTTPNGAMVLIPNQAALGNLMAEVFGPTYNQ